MEISKADLWQWFAEYKAKAGVEFSAMEKNIILAFVEWLLKNKTHVEETLTNTQIREQLYKLLPLFLIQNCQYNDAESVLIKRLIESLQPVNPEFEKYNEEHPMHGLPNQNEQQ